MTNPTHSPGTTPEQMPTRGHVKALMVLGLPLIGGHLGQMAIGITDTIMLGRYGVDALAAVTLGATFFHLLFLVGSGFAWAVMPLVATFAAEDDQTSLRRATRMGLWLSLVFAVISIPPLIFSDPLLRLMGQGDVVAAGASEYLRIAGWGILPALAVVVIKSYLAALEYTRPVLVIILLAAVVNGLFNWAFIFGNWGAPELGIAGAAWASIVTQVVMLVCIVMYTTRRLPEHDIFARFWRVDRDMLVRVFCLGWPIGLTTLSEAGLFSASAVMMGWLGEITLAAHGIAIMLASITFMVHLGLSNAATVRAGNALGRRDRHHLARGASTALWLSLLFSVVTIIVFIALPQPLIRIFVDVADPDFPEVLATGIVLLVAAALFQLVDGAQVIALGVLRGVQDTNVPMWMAAISYWVVGLPCSWALGFYFDWGGLGVWMGLVFGLACAAVLLNWRFWATTLHRAIPATE